MGPCMQVDDAKGIVSHDFEVRSGRVEGTSDGMLDLAEVLESLPNESEVLPATRSRTEAM